MTNRRKLYKSKDSENLVGGSPVKNDMQVTGSDREMTTNDKKMTVNDLPDDKVVTFKEVGDLIDAKPNTISVRWFPEKVLPAYADLNCPPLRTSEGKLTGFGAKAIAFYKRICIDQGKDYSVFCSMVKAEYERHQDAPPIQEVVEAELVDEVVELAPTNALTRIESRLSMLQDDRFSAIADTIYEFKKFGQEESKLKKAEDIEIELNAFQEELERQRLRLSGIKKAREFVRQQMENAE